MVRHKNRYLVVEVSEDGKGETEPLILKFDALHHAIRNTVQKLHGDFGVAAIRAGFVAKYCNTLTKIAIIKARRGPHKLVASVIPCIKYVDSKTVKIETLYLGATMRSCFKFIKEHQQKKINIFCLNLETEEEKQSLKDAILNIDNVGQFN